MARRNGLALLNPTLRLLLFGLLSTLFTLAHEWWAVLASLALALILLIAGRTFPRAPLVATWSAFVLTFLGNALFAKDPAATSLWVFQVSQASLLEGLRLGLRISAMILVAIAYIAVTPLDELLEGFRGLRIPRVADMYLTIMLRYVDILWYDIQVSMKAMAVRGVDWEGSAIEKVKAFRRLMLPLIFRIFDHIEGQSLTIDNRGGVFASRAIQVESVPGPAVRMREVHVRYNSNRDALAKINLELPRDTTTVLLGETGSGKSSLLLLCTGLIPHSIGRMKGEVQIFGFNSKEISLSKLGGLARIVFPSAVQGLVGLTVRDELAISLRVSTIPPEKHPQSMVQALQAVGLDESFLPRLTLGLSGGEMQRVALASAIVSEPRLLALDDVTVQLDPRGKREVIAALRSLEREPLTLVMTDPYVPLLQEMGDRFLLLEAGRLSQQTSALDPELTRRGGLRPPQLWQLGQKLGLDLPLEVEDALPVLRDHFHPSPPPFSSPPAQCPQPARKPLLETMDLTYTYPKGPTAIRDLNLAIYPGEFVAILGANGSGKTTAALLLAGALAPSHGKLLIEGTERHASLHRGMVGYVFQEPANQMVTMRVREELAFGPSQLGWDAARVERVVQREARRFGLDLEAVPLRLSPGEARKLAIAAVLAMEPKVVILDEPTNNLDENEVRQLMGHLHRLQREGTSVVIITHDVEIACEFADRVIVMHAGKILADGPTAQVMAQPQKLQQSDVIVPPVVAVSLALWPAELPALTVEALAQRLTARAATADERH